MTQPGATRSGYCKACYEAAIERICNPHGYVILKPGGQAAVAVPPLHPDMACDVRKAARAIMESRTGGAAARHPHHMGAIA